MSRFFDAHCDTLTELCEKNIDLCENTIHFDIGRAEEYKTYIQVFAAFIDKNNIKMTPLKHCLMLIDRYYTELEKNKGRISHIETADELEKALNCRGLYSILAIEGGEALEGSLSVLKMYYKMGVRLITLTWNYANELADGICESRGGGLTEFGRKAVSLMESLGIIIDVSHLSEKGFWDVVECTNNPFVASHSCVKSICGHKRNLSNAQIEEIIKREGCIGVNFYPEFLSDTGDCGIDMIYRHIRYILDMGGENTVGLGSDFDGVEYLPREIHGVQNMSDLIKIMEKEGLSKKQIDKISFENFYHVFRRILK